MLIEMLLPLQANLANREHEKKIKTLHLLPDSNYFTNLKMGDSPHCANFLYCEDQMAKNKVLIFYNTADTLHMQQ